MKRYSKYTSYCKRAMTNVFTISLNAIKSQYTLCIATKTPLILLNPTHFEYHYHWLSISSMIYKCFNGLHRCSETTVFDWPLEWFEQLFSFSMFSLNFLGETNAQQNGGSSITACYWLNFKRSIPHQPFFHVQYYVTKTNIFFYQKARGFL